ncbi:MAG TPA: c-type cytochrome, partial [Acidimicrobiales bacterium]|nr:c-type cytochrome [Acidimicrobiales bacterium]
YYDDDELETRRLDRALLFALGMLVVIAIGLPLYWLNEPKRQTGAARGFNNAAAAAGAGLFQSAKAPTSAAHPIHFGCADCHGVNGVGGAANFVVTDPAHPDLPPKTVQWSAPPLNSVLLRFTSDPTFTRSPGVPLDAVRTIIVYGRAGTPMPAWGLAGGGPMDDQQIDDLVAYIQSIQLTPAQATADWAQRAAGTAKSEGKVDASGNPIIDGQVLFDTNCARCHTKGYSYGAPEVPGGGGQFAPNITGGSEIRQFPNVKAQIAFVTTGVDFGAGYGVGGIGQTAGGGMPHFGNYLTQDEITMIVQYERSL